jgi:hypothetical protein
VVNRNLVCVVIESLTTLYISIVNIDKIARILLIEFSLLLSRISQHIQIFPSKSRCVCIFAILEDVVYDKVVFPSKTTAINPRKHHLYFLSTHYFMNKEVR